MAKVKVNKGNELRPGTVEYAAREHFEKEKAGYEERTGETCNYYLPTPIYSTPLPVETPVEPVESTVEEEVSTEGER